MLPSHQPSSSGIIPTARCLSPVLSTEKPPIYFLATSSHLDTQPWHPTQPRCLCFWFLETGRTTSNVHSLPETSTLSCPALFAPAIRSRRTLDTLLERSPPACFHPRPSKRMSMTSGSEDFHHASVLSSRCSPHPLLIVATTLPCCVVIDPLCYWEPPDPWLSDDRRV